MNGIKIRERSTIGEVYLDGEVIIRQGDAGDCTYVIQEGQVEFVVDQDCKEVRLGIREGGHFLGEMAIFQRRPRFATVPALSHARVLTVDRRSFSRRMPKDPSLAYHMMQTMSHRVRELSAEVARLQDQYPYSRSATTALHATAGVQNWLA